MLGDIGLAGTDLTAKANAAPQSHNIDVSMKYQYVDDHLVSRRDNTTPSIMPGTSIPGPMPIPMSIPPMGSTTVVDQRMVAVFSSMLVSS